MSDDRKLAMFIDFENIVRGVKEAQYKQFEIKLVLERLVEKGQDHGEAGLCRLEPLHRVQAPFHEHAIELIDVPQSRYSGKNSADIRMVVDAMDLAYAKAAHGHLRPGRPATRTSRPWCRSCVRMIGTS